MTSPLATFASKHGATDRDLQPQRVRHPLRFRLLEVVAVDRMSLSLTRVTLGGADLEGFVSLGFDDHVKLFFPDPDTDVFNLPEIGPEGPVWGEGARPVMRDYTPRHFDAALRTLAIDFALHTPGGPATRWTEQARIGQKIGVGGPKGSFIVPTTFDWHLFLGDDTALPAIARRLEELPAGTQARVLIEVEGPQSQIGLPSAAEVHVHWVYRGMSMAGSQPLLTALRDMTLLPGVFYSWVACESAQAKALREYLIDECRVNPRWIKASGYWRQGSADTHDAFDR